MQCTLRDFLREEETSEERLPIAVDREDGVLKNGKAVSEISMGREIGCDCRLP